MIKWQKREKVIFITLLVCIVIIPLIIHILFKIDIKIKFLYANWSAGDILQYAGTILASLLAIAGVYFTIKEGRSNNLENKIIETKPYLKTKITQLISFEEQETLDDNNNIVCIWDFCGTSSFNLVNIQGKRDFYKYHQKNDVNNYFIFKYEISNIGLGNAMNLEFNLCHSKFFPKTIICKGQVLELYIVLDRNIISTNGLMLEMKFEYKDILNINTYEQHERLFVIYNEKEKRYEYNRDFKDEISEPIIIEKKIFI